MGTNIEREIVKPDLTTAVNRIAGKLHRGYTGLAEMCGLHRSTVCHWARPRSKKGRDGSIPDKYHGKIIAGFADAGIPLKKEDLLNV